MQMKNNRCGILMKISALAHMAMLMLGCIFLLAGSVMQAFGDDVNYTRLRKRVIARELTENGTKAVYTYQQGAKTWCETNAVRQLSVRREIKYSKLKLITAAKAAGKWADVKAFIKAADMEDEWHACQYITSLHPAYIAATNAVVQAGIATEAEVRAFMKAAED
jgi:hypothetical protein